MIKPQDNFALSMAHPFDYYYFFYFLLLTFVFIVQVELVKLHSIFINV